MDCNAARSEIMRYGYDVESLQAITEGRNHYLFDILLKEGRQAIARFSNAAAGQTENLFGGPASLSREAGAYKLLGRVDGVPVPEIIGDHCTGDPALILASKLPGLLFCDYLAANAHSRECFLNTMRNLGKVIARVQQVRFARFGDVAGADEVYPPGNDNFADRVLGIVRHRIGIAQHCGVCDPDELAGIEEFFTAKLASIADQLVCTRIVPTLVLTDLHAMNFLVDEAGEVSGLFDLESCQAANPALEVYGLRLFLFSYYDVDTAQAAQQAFFDGYHAAGGDYDPADALNRELEDLLALARFLELAASYHGVRDGLRDNWSTGFLKLLRAGLATGEVDYQSAGWILHSKTGQLPSPLNP